MCLIKKKNKKQKTFCLIGGTSNIPSENHCYFIPFCHLEGDFRSIWMPLENKKWVYVPTSLGFLCAGLGQTGGQLETSFLKRSQEKAWRWNNMVFSEVIMALYFLKLVQERNISCNQYSYVPFWMSCIGSALPSDSNVQKEMIPA